MKKFIPVLKKSKLFEDVSPSDIALMLSCLGAQVKTYEKDEYVITEGDIAHNIAILISGRLHIVKDDYWGTRSIINIIEESDMFLESFSAAGGKEVSHSVVAKTLSAVMFFDVNKILTVCSSGCSFHSMIVKNLFFAVCEKNRTLAGRLNVVSKRSIREKLMAYLSEQAKKAGNDTFALPFNREQLSDYIFADRSAVSRELCKMREEGLIDFNKNKFTLLYK